MDALPDFYNDLAACQAEFWRCLTEGAGGRRSVFHTPVLATVDARGRPRVRTVVLRGADAAAGTVCFHCDRRSAKAAEIAAFDQAALHAYDAESKLQVRIEGTASLHTDDALADTSWGAAQPMSRVVYGIDPGPGTSLDAGGGYTTPEEDETATIGRENFCAVVLRAARLEFLYLARPGHRRAVWVRGKGSWTGSWVVP